MLPTVQNQTLFSCAKFWIIEQLPIVYDVLHLMATKRLPPPAAGLDEARRATQEFSFNVGFYGGPILVTLWPFLVLAGAIQMIRLRTYGLALTAAIIALLPCSPGCLLGLPFGIWALVALNKQEVKDAFQ